MNDDAQEMIINLFTHYTKLSHDRVSEYYKEYEAAMKGHREMMTHVKLPEFHIPQAGAFRIPARKASASGGVSMIARAMEHGIAMVYMETYSPKYGDTICRTFVVRRIVT